MGIGFAKALERLRRKMSYLFDSDKKNQTQQPVVENTQPEIVESVPQQAVTQDPFTVENAQSAQPKKTKTARTQATKKTKSAQLQAPAQISTAQEIQPDATANFELANDLDLIYPKETTYLNEKSKTKKTKRTKSKKAENDAQDIFADAEQRAEKERKQYKELDTSTPEKAKNVQKEKLEIYKMSDDEILKNREKRINSFKELYPDDYSIKISNDKLCRLYAQELERRKKCTEITQKGFVPTGKNTSAIPKFSLNMIGVSRSTRITDIQNLKGNREYLNEELLYYREKQEPVGRIGGMKMPKSIKMETIKYSGYEISVRDWLVFMAIVDCAKKQQAMGNNPFGILICKKRDIIDFVGWDTKKDGRAYKKILECLKILKRSTLTITSGNDIYEGNLISEFFTTIDDYENELQEKAERDLRRGEIYLKLPEGLAPFFNPYFSVDMRTVRGLLHGKYGDLAVWFYWFLMNMYYVEEKRTDPKTKRVSTVYKFQEIVELATLKEQCRFKGELKTFKRYIKTILNTLQVEFKNRNGELKTSFNKKHPYRLIIEKFVRPQLYDDKPALQAKSQIR